MDFVSEVEARCGRSLVTVDIGGGLSTSYAEADEPKEFAYKNYRKLLDQRVPGDFNYGYDDID